MLLTIVAQDNFELEQLDVKTVFWHGDLDETIYMDQPESFVNVSKPSHVCLLKKSLYGLKQSTMQWNRRFDKFILQNGYSKNIHDPCVYFRKLPNKFMIYLLLYVDDMLITTKSKADLYQLKQQLSSKFDMKDLGAARKNLGIEILRDREVCSICLSQEQYVKKVLFRFGMKNVKPVTTFFANHFMLSAYQSIL